MYSRTSKAFVMCIRGVQIYVMPKISKSQHFIPCLRLLYKKIFEKCFLCLLLLLPDSFRRNGDMADDHEAPIGEQLPRAWTRGCKRQIFSKSQRRKESAAKQCRIKREVFWDGCPQVLHKGFSILPILAR